MAGTGARAKGRRKKLMLLSTADTQRSYRHPNRSARAVCAAAKAVVGRDGNNHRQRMYTHHSATGILIFTALIGSNIPSVAAQVMLGT